MTLSRRELFGMFRRAADRNHPAGSVAPAPGASETGSAFSLDGFYAGRTGDRALPTFAIRATATAATSASGSGRSAAGDGASTPMARASTATAAAAGTAPAAATAIAPGLVPEVLPPRCLATSSFCSVCVERCPVPGAIVTEHGRPRVVADLCDGCGRCLAACPAPILAFALVARSRRAPA